MRASWIWPPAGSSTARYDLAVSEPAAAQPASAGFTVRPPWAQAPQHLRRTVHTVIANRLGPVRRERDVHGGMSPGPAVVLEAGFGRVTARVFVKAVSSSASQASYGYYRDEASALRDLPDTVPRPELVDVVHSGDWIALILDHVPGQAAGPPWTPDSIRRTDAALEIVASHRAPATVPPIADLARDLDGWERVSPFADRWERERAGRLAEAAGGWARWTIGDSTVHQDVRADNVLVSHDGAVLVDWSFCCAGSGVLDRARLAADIVCSGHSGGPVVARAAARAILNRTGETGWRFLIALAGMWRIRSTYPVDPIMPTMRRWQYHRSIALRPLIDEWLA